MAEGTTRLSVQHLSGDSFRADVRGHSLVVDQPVSAGGADAGPTPTELFVASLAACVAFFARRYLDRHRIPSDGLSVECSFAFAEGRPSRVGQVELRVSVPEGFPDDRRAGLLAVVEHCTVHNSIVQAPEIKIGLVAAGRAA